MAERASQMSEARFLRRYRTRRGASIRGTRRGVLSRRPARFSVVGPQRDEELFVHGLRRLIVSLTAAT